MGNVIASLAVVTMTADHVGAYLLPDQFWLRLVGRLAFPLYAYGVAVGIAKSRDLNKYAGRLVALAFVSSIASVIMSGHWSRWPVCVWGFAVAVFVVIEGRAGRWLMFSILCTCGYWLVGSVIDYGYWTVLLPVVLGVLISRGAVPVPSRRSLPSWFWWSWYPVHMLGVGASPGASYVKGRAMEFKRECVPFEPRRFVSGAKVKSDEDLDHSFELRELCELIGCEVDGHLCKARDLGPFEVEAVRVRLRGSDGDRYSVSVRVDGSEVDIAEEEPEYTMCGEIETRRLGRRL